MDDDIEGLKDLGMDNFNDVEVELNAVSSDDPAKPVPYVTNNRVTSIPRKCVRKGDIVCYFKNENINMINNNTQSATPAYSVNSDSKTHSSSETDNILSGESLYKTFIFEESLNDNDTQKCIAFWKSVMEKNLTPIKCTIIENKKKRANELKVEPEKKSSSIIENRDDIIKEATDKVHAEYKAMAMAALKEIKQKKLDQFKLVGKARCRLCETIENPMEEYSTDIDSAAIKEEVKGLNDWVSVSKSPKRGEIKGEQLVKKLQQNERAQTQYNFVNVIEEKKKSGAYKLWRSNKVKPPCSCGKKNCECNTNPAIICMRTPLSTLMAKSSKHIRPSDSKKITPKLSTKKTTPESFTRSYKEMTPKPSTEEKKSYKELTPKEVTPKEVTPKEVAPKEVTPKEVTPKEVAPKEVTPKEVISKEVRPKEEFSPLPSQELKKEEVQNMYDQILSRPSEYDKKYGSTQTPKDPNLQTYTEIEVEVPPVQVESDISDVTEEISGIIVRRATPFINDLAESVYREISAISTLPYAELSTFLKMPSEEFLAEVSALVLTRARELMESVSENLLQEISQIIVSKARPMLGMLSEKHETVEHLEIEQKATTYTEINPMPSIIKKVSDSRKGSVDHLSLDRSMERQVSVLLPTGEVEVTHSLDHTMDTSWEKPTVIPNKLPAAARKGSLEIIKAKKAKKGQPSLEQVESPVASVAEKPETNEAEVPTEFNIAVLHQGKDKTTATSKSISISSIDYGADQSEGSEKNCSIATPNSQDEKGDVVNEAVQINLTDDSETMSAKSEFEKRVLRDSIFVTKERAARHKKNMEETYGDEETDTKVIQSQNIDSQSNKIDSRHVRNSIFVTKERAAKHSAAMAKILLIEYPEPKDETEPFDDVDESKQTGVKIKKKRIRLEHVSKSKKHEVSYNEQTISLKNRHVRLLSLPVHLKSNTPRKLDVSSIKDSVLVSRDKMERNKLRVLEPKTIRDSNDNKKERQIRILSIPTETKFDQKHTKPVHIKDSIYVTKERVAKHKKDMGDDNEETEPTNRQIYITEPKEDDIHIQRVDPILIKDSIFVNKERVAKHIKYTGEDIEQTEPESRKIHISELKEEDTHIIRLNPMPLKDSVSVNKERVAKHKKDMSEDNEQEELENRQIRIRSRPIDAEKKKQKTHSKNSSLCQKRRKDMGKESYDPHDVEGINPKKNNCENFRNDVDDTEMEKLHVCESPTVTTETEIEESIKTDLLHNTPDHSNFVNDRDDKQKSESGKIYPVDLPVPCTSAKIVEPKKLKETHPQMLRHKPAKVKDSYPVKQKLARKGKKKEGYVSRVIYETDYENIKEKEPIGNIESITKKSVYACDPCYCIKCPTLKIGKGRKKVYACPLHAANKKEKKKKCRSARIFNTQGVSNAESYDIPTSLKVLLSMASSKESKYTEFQ